MRYPYILLILMFLLSNSSNGQNYFQLKNDKVRWAGTIGLGVGQENLISLPKLSGYVSFKLGKKKASNYGNFQRNSFYFGTEGSMLVFFAGAWSLAGNAGIKTGRFTTDCSINRLWLSSPEGDIVARQTTFNPKIGVMFGPVWIKAGPSFLLTNDKIFRDIFGNFMHIGGFPLNLEVNYNLTW